MSPNALPPHPDRAAPTLAVRDRLLAEGSGPFRPPGEGSADARVDLKLLAHAARKAERERGTASSRARLEGLDTPDLVAGTIQDGTARGCAVAFEEAISLCREPEPEPEPPAEVDVVEGPALRRIRDLLVASAGARVRFSRKGGIVFIDRDHGVHSENCVWFEDRKDCGDLDAFAPVDGERPRLFNPGFLKPVRYERGAARNRLLLEGRLGRRADGFPCKLTLEGRPSEPFVRMVVRIRNCTDDHRLRIRFLGCRNRAAIGHEGTPGWEVVLHRGRWFVAATIVRACGRLSVGDRVVAVPAAQCHGWIEHAFRLGGAPWSEPVGETSFSGSLGN